MSISATQNWISTHKRKDNAVERWNAALAVTQQCAATARAAGGDGFARASAYYDCRRGKKVAM